LKPEVEKAELELFRAGQFEDKDEVVEDASAPAAAPPPEPEPPEPPKVINHINESSERRKLNLALPLPLFFHFSGKLIILALPSIRLRLCRRAKLLPEAKGLKRYKWFNTRAVQRVFILIFRQ